MTFANWCAFLGLILMVMALSDSILKSLPFSSAAVYMLIGVAAGPSGLGLIKLDLLQEADAHLVEILTEIVVLISLFAVGLKLPVRSKKAPWKAPILLATVAMIVTVGLMSVAGIGFGWTLGLALLIGAVLAPTDPVLASEVQVTDAGDRDALRFGLTAEGGLNDGSAFPFVMLGLGWLGAHELGTLGWRWWTVDVLWAVAGGLALGWCCGAGFTRLVVVLRRRKGFAIGMESFLALGLIALTYGVAIHAAVYGFLAVFVAGLGMRAVEHGSKANAIAAGGGSSAANGPIAATANQVTADQQDVETAAEVSNLAMSFVEDLEKFAEMAAMLVIGSLLTMDLLTWRNVGLVACLIFVVRPIAVFTTMAFARWNGQQKRMGAWLGVRGVGSLYYLAFALTHGLLTQSRAPEVVQVVLLTIAASVVLHGVSATPLMDLYKRRSRRNPIAGA